MATISPMHNNSLKWAKKAAEQGHQEAQKWIASHSDPIKQTAGRAVNRTEEDYRNMYTKTLSIFKEVMEC